MSAHPGQRGLVILCAASILSAVLGSVHAFSVFLEPLETQFGASRALVSLTYSLALVALTIAVLLGHRVFARWSAPGFVLASAVIAAAGAVVAGVGGSIWVVWLGYSVMFGAANGLGYGFGLQIAAQANPGREGVAMGIVTAAYALGAVVSPALFSDAVEAGGFKAAMFGLSGVLIVAGGVSAGLMAIGRARFQAVARQGDVQVPPGRFALLWLGYFGGVMAGLMVIGHAAGIAAIAAPKIAPWLAPVVIAVCNLAGSLIAGRLADGVSAVRLLTGLPALTVLALLGLTGFGSGSGVLVFLGLAGFAYGGTIAAYPSVIAKRYGQGSAFVYGRVFTAWGSAGLAGPWFAGLLYDATGRYDLALLVAAGIGGISVVAAWGVFRSAAWRGRA